MNTILIYISEINAIFFHIFVDNLLIQTLSFIYIWSKNFSIQAIGK